MQHLHVYLNHLYKLTWQWSNSGSDSEWKTGLLGRFTGAQLNT